MPDNDRLAYPEISGTFISRFEDVEVGFRYVRDGGSFVNRHPDDGDRNLPETQQQGIVSEGAGGDTSRIWNGNDTEIKYEPETFGIDEMVVRVYTSKEPTDVAGRVATAFPESSPDVLRKVDDDGNVKFEPTT